MKQIWLQKNLEQCDEHATFKIHYGWCKNFTLTHHLIVQIYANPNQLHSDFILQYTKQNKVKQEYPYVEIRKVIYGYPQVDMLANKLLKTTSTSLNTLKYPSLSDCIILDWKIVLLCHLRLEFPTHNDRYCHVKIYKKQLQWCKHPYWARPQDCLNPAPTTKHITEAEEPLLTDTFPKLTKTGQTKIWQVVSIILYYAQAVNPTLPMALSTIASKQVHATKITK